MTSLNISADALSNNKTKISRSGGGSQEVSSSSRRPYKRRHSGPCLQQTPRPQEEDLVLLVDNATKRMRLLLPLPPKKKIPKTPAAPVGRRHNDDPLLPGAVISSLPSVSTKPGIFLPFLEEDDEPPSQNTALLDVVSRLKPRRRRCGRSATNVNVFPTTTTTEKKKMLMNNQKTTSWLPSSSSFPVWEEDYFVPAAGDDNDHHQHHLLSTEKEPTVGSSTTTEVALVRSTLKHSRSSIALCA